VVIEHAVLAQWLKVDPETRGSLFLQRSEVERHRWFDVVLAANFDPTDPVHDALTKVEEGDRGPKRPKNVAREVDTVGTCSATPTWAGRCTSPTGTSASSCTRQL